MVPPARLPTGLLAGGVSDYEFPLKTEGCFFSSLTSQRSSKNPRTSCDAPKTHAAPPSLQAHAVTEPFVLVPAPALHIQPKAARSLCKTPAHLPLSPQASLLQTIRGTIPGGSALLCLGPGCTWVGTGPGRSQHAVPGGDLPGLCVPDLRVGSPNASVTPWPGVCGATAPLPPSYPHAPSLTWAHCGR